MITNNRLSKFWMYFFVILTIVPWIIIAGIGLFLCWISYIISPAIFLAFDGKVSSWDEYFSWNEKQKEDKYINSEQPHLSS